ncbi:MAG TPA: trypsin-like peptidase domain-containing protein [Blastocatellia bacterium]|nr:trypsin-like peptidase domain-containing protein [Blastocatellia bacterium]
MEERFIGSGIEPEEAPVPDSDGIPIKRRSSFAWVAIVLILALLIGSIAIIQAALKGHTRAAVPELPPAATRPTAASPTPVELSLSFREIAKAVKPAVVNINVTESVQSSPSPFSDLFGDGPGQARPQRRPTSTGSGFIVTPDGYILTNDHVVIHAEQIEVTLADNRKMKAKVVGVDQESDLAVIKIDATNLPTVVLGNSDDVEQGDWVLALGSPFGLTQTLTAGIVSATGREVQGAQYSKFIQTDASINPGNSGGPLVSMQGEVIGINTMILTGSSMSNGNVGIGFAIASNIARKVFDVLVRNGKVTRGYLGVTVMPLDAPTARAVCLEAESGALVYRVPADTPAARAGLRGGDVITAFDGKPIKAPRELTDAVAATDVGKSVRVDFMRDCDKKSVTLEVVERPADINAAMRSAPEDGGQEDETRAARLGITAQTVTPELAAQGKLSISSGALVKSVLPGSPAADARIRHGDVIHRIDRTEVRTAEDLAEAEKGLKSGEEVAIKIERDRQIVFVTVTVP